MRLIGSWRKRVFTKIHSQNSVNFRIWFVFILFITFSAIFLFPSTTFNNFVSSLTIFVQDNYGADTTRINFIGFKGEFGKGKRRAVHTIYEVTPDALDKKVDEQAHELMQSNTNQTWK